MPDTVLLEEAGGSWRIARWLFTNRAGSLVCKKEENLTPHNARRAIMRAAAAVGGSSRERVAYGIRSDGRRVPLDSSEFDKVMTDLERGVASYIAIQALPQLGTEGRGHHVLTYRHDYSRVSSDASSFRMGGRTSRILDDGSEVASHAESVSSALSKIAKQVAAYIEDVRRANVEKIVLDFAVLDAAVCLLSVPEVTSSRALKDPSAVEAKRKTEVSEESDNEAAEIASDGSYDEWATAREPKSKARATYDALDNSDSPSPAMSPKRWAEMNPSAAAAMMRERSLQEAALMKKSSSLPVLNGQADEPETGVPCDGKFCACSVEHVDAGTFVLRTHHKIRQSHNASFQMANRWIMLADKCKSFITVKHGLRVPDEPVAAGDTHRAAEWRKADDKHGRQLGARDPSRFYKQAMVCPDCYNVYSKLDKLRQKGFMSSGESPGKDKGAGKRPSSEGQTSKSRRTRKGAKGGAGGAGGAGALGKSPPRTHRGVGASEVSASRGPSRRDGSTAHSAAASPSSMARGASAGSGTPGSGGSSFDPRIARASSRGSSPSSRPLTRPMISRGSDRSGLANIPPLPPRTPTTGGTMGHGGLDGLGSARSFYSDDDPGGAAGDAGTGGGRPVRGGGGSSRAEDDDAQARAEKMKQLEREQAASIAEAAFGGEAPGIGGAWGLGGSLHSLHEGEGDEDEVDEEIGVEEAASAVVDDASPTQRPRGDGDGTGELKALTPADDARPSPERAPSAGVPVPLKKGTPRSRRKAASSTAKSRKTKGPAATSIRLPGGGATEVALTRPSVSRASKAAAPTSAKSAGAAHQREAAKRMLKRRVGGSKPGTAKSSSSKKGSTRRSGSGASEDADPSLLDGLDGLSSALGASEVAAEEVPDGSPLTRRSARRSAAARTVPEDLIASGSARKSARKSGAAATVDEDISAVVSRYQSDIARLEAEVTVFKERARAEQSASAVAHERLRDAQKRLAEAQRSYAAAMREKDEEIAKERLRLEEQYNTALLARAGSSEGVPTDGSGAGGDGSHSKELLETISSLHRRYDQAEKVWASAKQAAEEETRRRVTEADRRMAAQAAAAKRREQELDDKIHSLEEDVARMMRDVNVAAKKERAARDRAERLDLEARKLRQDVRDLQRGLEEASAAGGGGTSTGDKEALSTALATLKATSEAKVNKLSNEVEYLKASLASELTCKEELGSSLAEVNERFANAQAEWRERVEATEQSKREELAAAEARFRRELEKPRAEVSMLEEKVMRLQMTVTDMTADVKAARQREDAARTESATLMRERADLLEKVQSLQRDVDELTVQKQRSKESEGMTSAIKATADAAVRRAQNEATYLRSQLEAESALKAKLEAAVAEANARNEALLEERRTREEEADARVGAANEETRAKVEALTEANMKLEAELMQMDQQVTESAKRFERAKEAQRRAEAEAEVKTAAVARLEDALAQAEKQALEAQVAAEQAAKRHENSLTAAQSTVAEISDAKDKTITRLRADLTSRLERLTEAQREMLALRQRLTAEQLEHKKTIGAERMAAVLVRWRRRRTVSAWSQWMGSVAADSARKEADARQAAALEEAAVAAQEDKEKACRLLLTEFRAGKRDAVNRVAGEAAARLEAMEGMAQADAEAAAVRERARARHALSRQRETSETLARAAADRAARELEEAVHAVENKAASQARALVERLTEERVRAVKQWEEKAAKELDEKLQAANEERDQAVRAAIAAERRRAQEALLHADEVQHEAARAAVERARQQWELEAAQAAARAKEAERAAVAEAIVKERESSQRAMDTLEGKHQATVESVMRQSLLDRQELTRAVLEEKAKAVAAVEERAKAAREEDRLKHEGELAVLREQHREELVKAVADAVEKGEAAAKAARDEAGKNSNELAAAARREADARVDAARAAEAEARSALAKAQANIARLEGQVRIAEETGKRALTEALEAAKEDAEQAAKAAADARAEAVTAAERDAEARLDEVRAELQQAHEDAVGELLAKAEAEREEALEAAEARRRAAVDAFLEEADAEKQRAERDAEQRIADAVAAARDEVEREFEQERAEVDAKHKQVLEAVRQAAEEDKRGAVQRIKAQAEKEQEEAMQELKEESEKLLGSIENAMASLMNEKKTLERHLEEATERLDASEDTVYDYKTKLEQQMKLNGALQLRHIAATLRYITAHNAAMDELRDEADDMIIAEREQQEKEKAQLTERMDETEEKVHQLETLKRSMTDTLMSHKREVLVEHKVKSSVLQNELAELEDMRAELDDSRRQLLKEVGELEGSVHALEREMQEHNKTSAIGADGRVNVAHSRKKKRLDADLDRALERVGAKREQLEELESELQEVDARRLEKEEAMKEIETTLVSVLVDQQRKLMGVLHNSGTAVHAAVKFKRMVSNDDDDQQRGEGSEEGGRPPRP